MTRYLVTGVAGFIGRSIAKRLLDQGHSVRGIDNLCTGKRENLEGLDGLDFIEADVADSSAVAKACNDVQIVFHEAAIASVPRSVADPLPTNHANVTGTIELLNAARHAGVHRVIYAASSSAYGDSPTLPKHERMLPDPISPYAVSKLAGEHYMGSFFKVYGLETVALRYFNVFGPYQDPSSQYSGVLAKFIPMMLRGEVPTIHGDGSQSRDFTFVDNVINANLLAAHAPAERVAGKVFNIATGFRITLNETAELIRKLTGYAGPVHHGPERAGDIRDSLADISAAHEALGYEPSVSFEDGLQRTITWYRTSMTAASQ
jgi:nucleoside-diphosphate-sugar epimerase